MCAAGSSQSLRNCNLCLMAIASSVNSRHLPCCFMSRYSFPPVGLGVIATAATCIWPAVIHSLLLLIGRTALIESMIIDQRIGNSHML